MTTSTLVIVFVSFLGLPTQDDNHEQARRLMSEANKVMDQFGHTKEARDKILFLYEEAISFDTLYPQPYFKEADVLCQFNERRAALAVLERIRRINPKIMGILAYEGFILERMGKFGEATQKYKADLALDDSVIKFSEDSLAFYARLSRASMLLFLNRQSAGLQEFNKILAQYPDSPAVKLFETEYFHDFDRKKFISGF